MTVRRSAGSIRQRGRLGHRKVARHLPVRTMAAVPESTTPCSTVSTRPAWRSTQPMVCLPSTLARRGMYQPLPVSACRWRPATVRLCRWQPTEPAVYLAHHRGQLFDPSACALPANREQGHAGAGQCFGDVYDYLSVRGQQPRNLQSQGTVDVLGVRRGGFPVVEPDRHLAVVLCFRGVAGEDVAVQLRL